MAGVNIFRSCHHLKTEQYALFDSAYGRMSQESLEGLDRSIKALQVLLDNEDDLMEVILFFTNLICSGLILTCSWGCILIFSLFSRGC